MLRRQARLRREFLFKKSVEIRQCKLLKKKQNVRRSLKGNAVIPGDVQKDALNTYEKLKYDYENNNAVDNEYRFSTLENPKVMLTTSHQPSARLKMFVKELKLIFPNSQKINRGRYEIKQLMHACRVNEVTDLIIVHEHRGIPDNLVICHLPYGPTAFFNISGVIMRHDIPNIGTMSEQNPHLIFHNLKTNLGKRTESVLKNLFPTPRKDSRRVITFANNDDYISFRHHTYEHIGRELHLSEVGPRFQLKLYQMKLGTLDELQSAETEWVFSPYINTTARKLFLSCDKGWKEDENMTFQ